MLEWRKTCPYFSRVQSPWSSRIYLSPTPFLSSGDDDDDDDYDDDDDEDNDDDDDEQNKHILMKMDEDGWRWTSMDEDGWRWMKMDEDG